MSEVITGHFEGQPIHEAITLELSENDIVRSMQAYLDFLALPESIKRQFHFFNTQTPRTGKSGYLMSEHDNKFIYHHTPDFWRMQNQMPADLKPRAAREFFDVADEMYYSVARGVKAKFDEWSDEENSPWISSATFTPEFHPKLKHHLRFLAYADGRARGHYDKSFATVAVAQSKNGLRIGSGPADLELAQRENFDPLIFRGYGWHQMHEMLGQPTDKIAAWHDVIDVDEPTDERIEIPDKIGDLDTEISRVSIVDFINPANIYLDSTVEQTHTPVRWRKIGRAIVPNAVPFTFLAA